MSARVFGAAACFRMCLFFRTFCCDSLPNCRKIDADLIDGRVHVVGFRNLLCTLLLALLWEHAAGFCGQAPAADAPNRSAAISRTSRAPVIDGVLTDAAWLDATVLGDFTQRVPYNGEKASDETVVRIMRDDRYIYVGAYMYQEPRSIRRNKIRRHDNLPQDDTIEVIFDTFHDHLRGFIFLTNANGAKHDTQVDGFKGFNNNWDEVWDVHSSLQPDGWCAEFRIPVRVLRFQPGRDVWGFNVQRRIQHKQEWDYWSPVPTQYDVSHLGYAGNLSGFADLAQQRNLQAIPALVPTRLQAEGLERARYDVEPSLDVKYVLGSNMTLDLTANTDFAQVEADETQVNLTRFSLFFPEKREFFLESASVFDFGVAADTQLFFSRRIGIANGHEVPIFGGARLTGKAGRYDVGVMNMQTKESPDQPATNYSVVRLRRGLRGRSTVGAIFTNADNTRYENRAYGLDTSLWLSPTLQFKGFVASTVNSGTDPDGTAHLASLDYQTDSWGLTLSEKTVGAGFDPGIGYVRRRDIRSAEGVGRHRHRFNRGWSRNVDLTAGISYLTDTGGRLLTRVAAVEASNVLPSGAHFGAAYSRQFEQLTEDFRIMPEVTIPLAPYGFQRTTLDFTSANSRRVYGRAECSWGSFYNGTEQTALLSNTVQFSPRFRTTWQYEYNRVRLPTGGFSTSVARVRVGYDHNPNLGISGLLQWNSITREFSANILLRVIYARDSNVYLVFNERQLDRAGGWMLSQRAAIFKITYRLYL